MKAAFLPDPWSPMRARALLAGRNALVINANLLHVFPFAAACLTKLEGGTHSLALPPKEPRLGACSPACLTAACTKRKRETVSALKIEAPREGGRESGYGACNKSFHYICEKAASARSFVRSFVQYPKWRRPATSWAPSVTSFPDPSPELWSLVDDG